MGNRAVITIKNDYIKKEDWHSIYLHWNGFRYSLTMLDVAKGTGQMRVNMAQLDWHSYSAISLRNFVNEVNLQSANVDNYDNEFI